jgi:hypothetical protein
MAAQRHVLPFMFAALVAMALPAAAQLEGALSPGALVEGHAKYDNDCQKCHVRFDKNAQDGRCLDCHKPVAEDIERQKGMHGRIKRDACRTCHTDHKGRKMNIAPFDTARFDHAKTDFALQGAHGPVKCESCHAAGKRFREAPGDCNGCHQKDDKHKGSLGKACADCHNEVKWKDVRFDHDKTRFKLRDKHVKVECAACHKSAEYKDTPMTCIGCHRKDDKHKGRYGDKCENCHDAANWKVAAIFNHDTATKFVLRFKHRSAKCEACHTGFVYKERTDAACIACHKKEDKHAGTLGPLCADCHTDQSWGKIRFDHGKTKFALAGKHTDLECKKCHADNTSFKDTPMACVSCHLKDDTHKTRYGEKCETCHADTGWKDMRFSHDRDTKYPLRGLHGKVACDKCHAGALYKEKAPTACIGCHRKDDKHRNQLGDACERCHLEDGWNRVPGFNHNRTRFPLLGRHGVVECKSCHATPAYKDARSDCFSCHEKDDKHKKTLGRKCETCHNARDWRVWDFNHDRRTKFPLEDGHAKLRCDACHRVATDDARIAMGCYACHGKDDVHEGGFGRVCERCHFATKFSRIKPGMGRGVVQ